MRIYKEQFGKRLREAIKEARITQAKLAEAVGVEPPAVSRWVNGLDFPDDSRMPKICKMLNVSEEYFVHDQRDSMSAGDLLTLLESHKDVLFLLPKIPKDVIKLLARQDDIYHDSLKRTLEGLEDKKTATPKKASS